VLAILSNSAKSLKPMTIGSCNVASADERFYNLPLFVDKALGSRTAPRSTAHGQRKVQINAALL
jgi:hypothetical protein